MAYGASSAEALVTGIAATRSGAADAETPFRVGATHVFWAENKSIWRAAPTPGATPEPLRQDLGNVANLALSDTHSYYADRTQNTVGRMALDTLAHEQLQSDIQSQDMHLHG